MSNLLDAMLKNIPRNLLTIEDEIIGKGNFGVVRKGTMEVRNGGGESTKVDIAVKFPNEDDPETTKGLLDEGILAAKFNHENVSRVLGVVTIGTPILLLVFEFYENGNLHKCLEDREKTCKTKIAVPRDVVPLLLGIAKGMEYISGKSFIHRDLAARNIMLGKNNIPKVSDFGMSKKMSEPDKNFFQTNTNEAMPVRWVAPEVFKSYTYTEKTDVWSFGILVTECYTKGAAPYWGWNNNNVLLKVMEGFKLPCPPSCPKKLYEQIVSPCLNLAPDRPNFNILVKKLKTLKTLDPDTDASNANDSVNKNHRVKLNNKGVWVNADSTNEVTTYNPDSERDSEYIYNVLQTNVLQTNVYAQINPDYIKSNFLESDT